MSVTDIDWQGSALGRYAALTAGGAAHDEVIGAHGVREEQQLIAAAVEGMGLSGLLAARAEARRLVRDDGVHYGGDLQGRQWLVDPIPLVITGDEWAHLEAGLQQRAVVLDLLLADLYGERRLIQSGVVPGELVFGHAGFLPQAVGVRLPGERQLVFTGTDLARGSDGEWFVLSDRTGVPSGAGYAMVNRRITSRVMANLHRNTRLTRLRSFFEDARRAVHELAPAGARQVKTALLWPGSGGETSYEMGFLATLLGMSLVEGDDLVTRGGEVFIDGVEGATRIDVLLRRVDSVFCDPLEWRSDSHLGVPGLLEAARRGQISIANPLGSGVLENPALMPSLPAITRALLDQDPLLQSTPTLWCGDPAGLREVLSRLPELVIKPIARGVASSSILGWTLSEDECQHLAERIGREPWAWVGQDPMLTSTAPVVTGQGLEPRRLVLRSFGVAAADGYRFMAGGLARVAAEPDSFVISNMTGALAKDVWVLDDSTTLTEQIRTDTRQVQLWDEGSDARQLAPRVADNLHWFGRYAERADATARLVRLAINLSEDHAARPGTTGHTALAEVARTVTALTGMVVDEGDDPVAARALLRRLATDETLDGSLAFALRRLEAAAREAPTVMSSDVWHVLATCDRVLDEMTGDPERMLASDFQAGLLAVQQSTMALFGIIGESFVRDQSWAFIDLGVRLERAIGTLALIGVAFTEKQSVLVADRVADVVLDASDSLITHRRRSAAGVGPTHPPASVTALLVSDATNPRAVLHQLDRAVVTAELIGDGVLVERLTSVRDQIASSHAVTLHGSEVGEVWRLCLDLADELRAIAAGLGARHFTRPTTRRPLLTPWFSQASPRLDRLTGSDYQAGEL